MKDDGVEDNVEDSELTELNALVSLKHDYVQFLNYKEFSAQLQLT
jgi:hypothetical protein